MQIPLISFVLALLLSSVSVQSAESDLTVQMQDSIKILVRSNYQDFQKKMGEIKKSYQHLDRSSLERSQVSRLRFQMQFWRQKVLQILLHEMNLMTDIQEDKLALFFNILADLDIKLNEQHLEDVFVQTNGESFLDFSPKLQEAITRFILSQGDIYRLETFVERDFLDALDPMLGPQEHLDINPIKSSAWTFSEWSKLTDFTSDRYKKVEGGFFYKGQVFYPGDILLNNLERDSDGLYTSLTDPMDHFSHAAFYVLLQHEEKEYPAVIEIHEHGVRALPLSVFVSQKFTSYLEIYRYEEMTKDQYVQVNAEAMKLMKNVKGFNFLSSDSDPDYLTCTGVGHSLFQNAGLNFTVPMTPIGNDNLIKNLHKLQFFEEKVISPMDYTEIPKMNLVGVIDNDQEKVFLREMVRRKIKDLFSSKELNLDYFPWMYSINKWGVNQMRSGSYLGMILMYLFGFNSDTLPKGPVETVAIIEIWEGAMTDAMGYFSEESSLDFVDYPLEKFSLEHLLGYHGLGDLLDEAVESSMGSFFN